jgi:hypothetical protein
MPSTFSPGGGPPLKGPHRGLCLRTEVTVDRHAELTLELGDLRPLRTTEDQNVGVDADRNGWARRRRSAGLGADAGLDVGTRDVHVDRAWIPFPLRPTGVLLAPDGAGRGLRQPAVDRRTAVHQREVLLVGPVRAMRSRRTRTAVGAFDTDHVPIAHIGRKPRIHAYTRVPRDTDRHHSHRAVTGNVQLGHRPRQIGAAVRNRRGGGIVGSGVVHHDPADILEVAVAAVPPARVLDELDALSSKHIGDPYRVARPDLCLRHTRMVRRHTDTCSDVGKPPITLLCNLFAGFAIS